MPSASVLKPCARISPETGSEKWCSGCHCPAAARASNLMVFTAPQVLADSSSASTISTASSLCGTVRFSPAELHGLGAFDGGAQIFGVNFKREVTPVQAERGERGIVHRGRRGMADGKAIDRAQRVAALMAGETGSDTQDLYAATARVQSAKSKDVLETFAKCL